MTFSVPTLASASTLTFFCKASLLFCLFFSPLTYAAKSKYQTNKQPEKAGVLNVHIVCHTHDDVGWLKTVDQYYQGANQTIQNANIAMILDTVTQQLEMDENRKFTYVEQAYFSRWWNEQSEEKQLKVKTLVKNGQFEFTNGGWCMHDEAATHYIGMIDQTTLGHDFIKENFGEEYLPRIGWQIDPFGHSATQASLLSAKVGFDALYFGRIDYQDMSKRQETGNLEMIWDASPSLGSKDGAVFTGIWPSGNYGPPTGFCWDGVACADEPIMDDPALEGYNVPERVEAFYKAVMQIYQKGQRGGDNIMLQFGSDFQYSNAFAWYKNIDKLIYYANEDGRLNVFYSTPIEFTEAKNKEGMTFTKKTDDFFPYADREHGYWTGYFTSRASLKKYERVTSSLLQSARQIQSFAVLESMKKGHTATTTTDTEEDKHHQGLAKKTKESEGLGCPFTCPKSMQDLEAASGVVQHHDGVSGTSKQHVAYDYAKMLAKGVNNALSTTLNALSYLMNPDATPIDGKTTTFQYCPLLNETTCDASVQFLQNADKSPMQIVVWNPLAQKRSVGLQIPMMEQLSYTVLDSQGREVPSTVMEATWSPNTNASPYTLSFQATDLPPLGYTTYTVKRGKSLAGRSQSSHEETETERVILPEMTTAIKTSRRNLMNDKSLVAESDMLKLEFDKLTGRMISLTRKDLDLSMPISQDYFYYNAYEGEGQHDGAYIFRPREDSATAIGDAKLEIQIVEHENVLTEVHQSWGSWVNQTISLWHGRTEMDIHYSVGPVPLDGHGKSVVSRFTSGIENKEDIYTDSNGREFQYRQLNYRPTWDLDVNEAVAGNYYPMNAAAYIKDQKKQFSLVTDRSQGVASLKAGEMEVMVQRRLLVDDARGVGEPLNETTDGIIHVDSALDARLGQGVVIRGKHSLLFGESNDAIIDLRKTMDEMFFTPLIAFTNGPGNQFLSASSSKTNEKSMSNNQALPSGISLITFKSLTCEKEEIEGKQFLVRLANQYAIDEKAAAQSISVNLKDYFSQAGYKLTEIVETTLAGNKPLSTLKRLTWKVDDGSLIGGQGEEEDGDDEEVIAGRKAKLEIFGGSDITMKPMDIRTFVITLE